MKFDKLKEIGPVKLGGIFVLGVLLLFLSCSDIFEKKEVVVEESTNKSTQSETEYRHDMERQVVELLQQVEGVGKTKVMITLASSKEKVTLKDNENSGEANQEESVLVEDTDHNSSPYVLKEMEPVPEGVLVVCEGGGNEIVRSEIISAIQVLFHVEVHKIKVMKMES